MSSQCLLLALQTYIIAHSVRLVGIFLLLLRTHSFYLSVSQVNTFIFLGEGISGKSWDKNFGRIYLVKMYPVT